MYACCELLQNVYLCISTYNHQTAAGCEYYVVNCFKMCIFALARTTDLAYSFGGAMVVNCFKMCIFALARTTKVRTIMVLHGCELLQNVYLCISTYNRKATSTYITVSNKAFVQIKNAKQKSPITMMGLFFRIILVAVLGH